jgi:hypothetical protein
MLRGKHSASHLNVYQALTVCRPLYNEQNNQDRKVAMRGLLWRVASAKQQGGEGSAEGAAEKGS